ncbi:MAG: hypothetical protein ACOCWR_05580 [Oceanidesulfovibrio sp.]
MLGAVLSSIFSIIVGALGYLIVTFHCKPILQYLDVKNQILIDFIFYAQVINSDCLNEEMKVLHSNRIHANRLASARLASTINQLPGWYLKYLKSRKKQNPERAVGHLIGYSNTSDNNDANKIKNAILKNLGITLDI